MTIERTWLPGVGVAHVTTTRGGQRLGVVSRFTGEREIVLYDVGDPDTVAVTVPLEPDEAHTIADLLGPTITVDHVRALEQQLDGIVAVRVRLPAGSPYDGRRLADLRAGCDARASIVAVSRDDRLIVGPGSTVVLRHGDILVLVGDQEGVTGLAGRLTDEEFGGRSG